MILKANRYYKTAQGYKAEFDKIDTNGYNIKLVFYYNIFRDEGSPINIYYDILTGIPKYMEEYTIVEEWY